MTRQGNGHYGVQMVDQLKLRVRGSKKKELRIEGGEELC